MVSFIPSHIMQHISCSREHSDNVPKHALKHFCLAPVQSLKPGTTIDHTKYFSNNQHSAQFWIPQILPPTASFSAQREKHTKGAKVTFDSPLRPRGIVRLTKNSAGSRGPHHSHGSAKWHLHCRCSTRVTHPHHYHLPVQELWWLECGSDSPRKQEIESTNNKGL